MKKRIISLLLILTLLFSCVPLAFAEQAEMYSCDSFRGNYAAGMALGIQSATELNLDSSYLTEEEMSHYLWLDPYSGETRGSAVTYQSASGSNVFTAEYSGKVDESAAADKLLISFTYPSGMTSLNVTLAESVLDYAIVATIYFIDNTDRSEIVEFIKAFDEEGGTHPSSMPLKSGYNLTISESGRTRSYEISKPVSASNPSASQSGTIFCPQCGKKIDATSKFCMFCGNTIPSVSSGGSQPVAPATKSWSSWSSWSTTPVYESSTRQVETKKTVKGYNMFHYRTQFRDAPYPRVFRDYSINGDYDWKYSRKSYGEKYMEKYVTASELASATTYSPDSRNVYNGKHPGYQDGTTIAYGFNDDEFMWFIANEVSVTEYRYRDLS